MSKLATAAERDVALAQESRLPKIIQIPTLEEIKDRYTKAAAGSEKRAALTESADIVLRALGTENALVNFIEAKEIASWLKEVSREIGSNRKGFAEEIVRKAEKIEKLAGEIADRYGREGEIVSNLNNLIFDKKVNQSFPPKFLDGILPTEKLFSGDFRLTQHFPTLQQARDDKRRLNFINLERLPIKTLLEGDKLKSFKPEPTPTPEKFLNILGVDRRERELLKIKTDSSVEVAISRAKLQLRFHRGGSASQALVARDDQFATAETRAISAEELTARCMQAETSAQKVEVLREAAARLLGHIDNQRAGNLAMGERTITPNDFTQIVQIMKTLPELMMLTENMREVAFAMTTEEAVRKYASGEYNLKSFSFK